MNSPSLGSESPLPSISDPKKEQIQMSNNGDEKSEELEEQSPIKLV
jgi:hypothetical protein